MHNDEKVSFKYLSCRGCYTRPELRKNFTGTPDHVVNFFVFIANEVREIMAELGIRKFNDLIGRRDLLILMEQKNIGKLTDWI